MSSGGAQSDSDEEYLTPEEPDGEEMRLEGTKQWRAAMKPWRVWGKQGSALNTGKLERAWWTASEFFVLRLGRAPLQFIAQRDITPIRARLSTPNF